MHADARPDATGMFLPSLFLKPCPEGLAILCPTVQRAGPHSAPPKYLSDLELSVLDTSNYNV